MQIVQGLVKQIDGTLETSSVSGTTHKFTFRYDGVRKYADLYVFKNVGNVNNQPLLQAIQPNKSWNAGQQIKQGEYDMPINFKALDALRRGRSEHDNHLIDCLVAGRVSRREFMRHGSVLGMSVAFLASVTAAIGMERPFGVLGRQSGRHGAHRANRARSRNRSRQDRGGGGITVLSQVAETLVLSGEI